ncbi:prolyl oligopeptidase family serine peptidase [Actinoplanes sp. CA-142083]|uniref:prolyl oligopeptidase family serine peptidase n=1 Tax=Actinoplanes sp. CA-142083 TaxID=3239903 RepID=UPI003D94AD3A
MNGTAAGVPYVALPPADASGHDTVVVAYHLLGDPQTEEAFADAVPLTGLNAWRLYFGLPMSGKRLPRGGLEELIMEDAVRNVHRHVTLGALEEFPAAFAAAKEQLGIRDATRVGVMGGSMGGAVAQLVLAEGGVDITAAVLINPVVQFRNSIDALSRRHGQPYAWSAETDAVADRLDFVRRAADLRGAAIRFITGADDMVDAIIEPVSRAVPALETAGATVDWQVVPEMAHAVTSQAARVDSLASEWFAAKLTNPA